MKNDRKKELLTKGLMLLAGRLLNRLYEYEKSNDEEKMKSCRDEINEVSLLIQRVKESAKIEVTDNDGKKS